MAYVCIGASPNEDSILIEPPSFYDLFDYLSIWRNHVIYIFTKGRFHPIIGAYFFIQGDGLRGDADLP
jgi:hypothetical protein